MVHPLGRVDGLPEADGEDNGAVPLDGDGDRHVDGGQHADGVDGVQEVGEQVDVQIGRQVKRSGKDVKGILLLVVL